MNSFKTSYVPLFPSTYVWTTAGYFTLEEINTLRTCQGLAPETDDVSHLRIRIPPTHDDDEDPCDIAPSPSAPPAY